MSDTWFLTTPEELEKKRIDLNLGLRSSMRYYNDLVAPGIGGVRFVRQLTWSCLAVKYAKPFKVSAIRLGNAIEAYGLKAYRSCSDDEYSYKGKRAFDRSTFVDENSFKGLSKARNYVQITYRQNTTRSLPFATGLGLVEGSNGFESFVLSPSGQELIAQHHANFSNPSIEHTLSKWVSGEKPMTAKSANERFGPISTPGEKTVIFVRLNAEVPTSVPGLRNDTGRRKKLTKLFSALSDEWNAEDMKRLYQKYDLELFYEDLNKANDFYQMQAAGQTILIKIYALLSSLNGKLPLKTRDLTSEIENLIRRCHTYIRHQDSSPEAEAAKFATFVITHEKDHHNILRELALRDRRVCDVVEESIIKGPLYRTDITTSESEDLDLEVPSTLRNFYALWRDANEK